MSLAAIDWILIVAFLALSLGIALKYSAKAGQNLGEFFLGGRSLPWWIAGTSMVATTFAADTPLAVTELVVTKGISGNWLWWNMVIGGMLTTFFFARLWRRANILTEVEFINLRYDGKPARFLRGFKALYLGLFMNVLVMGWVNLALHSILKEFFHLSDAQSFTIVAACMVFVAIYSALSGLMGVAITDLVQFVIAMAGCIVLAVIVLHSEKVGGISGLKEKLAAHPGVLDFAPGLSDAGGVVKTFAISIGALIAYTCFQWWASWYPGAEPGGGGYVAQRMMSTKGEKHSILATLFFQLAHYCLRPWPWIIVGLCVIVIYPDLEPGNERMGYVMAMNEFLPAGLKGLLLVSFLAAYMSTISTQLNWGASYIVNDYYLPFVKKQTAEEVSGKSLIRVSRLVTVLLMAISLLVTPMITSISGVWTFMIECGAGLGLVLILRWFWWRINAWSEIAATLTPFLVFAFCQFVTKGWIFMKFAMSTGFMGLFFLDDGGWEYIDSQHSSWGSFPNSYFITIGVTTVVWVLVTLLTQPESREKLSAFYQRIRPGGWWKPVREPLGLPHENSGIWALFGCWFSGIALTYSFLFASGKLILGFYGEGMIWTGAALASAATLWICMKKAGITEAE